MRNSDFSSRTKNDHRFSKPRYTKKPRRPDFIYNGDLCFFEQPVFAHPADEDGHYNSEVVRVIHAGEHVFYHKRFRKSHTEWRHLIEIYGLFYIYEGSIKDFTKKFIPYKEGWPEENALQA